MYSLAICRLEKNPIHLESSLSRSATKEKKEGGGDKKYEQYHGFNMSITSLKAHQVINPLSPDVKMHVLLSVLHTFLMELVRRICLNVKTSYPWGLFPLFSSLVMNV